MAAEKKRWRAMRSKSTELIASRLAPPFSSLTRAYPGAPAGALCAEPYVALSVEPASLKMCSLLLSRFALPLPPQRHAAASLASVRDIGLRKNVEGA